MDLPTQIFLKRWNKLSFSLKMEDVYMQDMRFCIQNRLSYHLLSEMKMKVLSDHEFFLCL